MTTTEVTQQVATEFKLVYEDGEWYVDAPVFERHKLFNALVNALIKARACACCAVDKEVAK